MLCEKFCESSPHFLCEAPGKTFLEKKSAQKFPSSTNHWTLKLKEAREGCVDVTAINSVIQQGAFCGQKWQLFWVHKYLAAQNQVACIRLDPSVWCASKGSDENLTFFKEMCFAIWDLKQKLYYGHQQKTDLVLLLFKLCFTSASLKFRFGVWDVFSIKVWCWSVNNTGFWGWSMICFLAMNDMIIVICQTNG